MPWIPAAIAVGGAIAGALKKGPEMKQSALGQQAQDATSKSLSEYQQYVQNGPGMMDYQNGLSSQRDFASLLKGYQSGGMYDMSAGRSLAEQQFGGQRQLMATAFQDQLNEANRSASLNGRSSNDPILRARLAQEQTRQGMQLNASQAQAMMGFARQSATDQVSLASNRNDVLSGLGNQAMSNRSNLLQMSNAVLSGQEVSSMRNAMYEQSRGGGLKGAVEGGIAGAAAGMQMAQGFGAGGGGATPDAAGGTTSFSTDYMKAPDYFSQANAAAPAAAPRQQRGPAGANVFSNKNSGAWPTLNGKQVYGPF